MSQTVKEIKYEVKNLLGLDTLCKLGSQQRVLSTEVEIFITQDSRVIMATLVRISFRKRSRNIEICQEANAMI